MSSGVAQRGQRRGERDAETVCGGGGHGGVVLVLLLGSWAFVFDEIMSGIGFLSVAKIIGRDNDFSCRNQYVLQVCYNSSIVIQSTDANVIETVSIF